MSINDYIRKVVSVAKSVNDALRQYYKGASSATDTLPDSEKKYWQSSVPAVSGTVQDVKKAALMAKGFTGTLQDMTAAYWRSLARGILVALPNTEAAYSLRRVNGDYTGNAIRVRRSSDNAEADIGFDSQGNLDEYALMNHVGAENLFTYSEDFSNAAWVKTGGTYTNGALIEDTSNGSHYLRRNSQVSGTTQCCSKWVVKPAGKTRIMVHAEAPQTSGLSAIFDLTGAGTVASGNGTIRKLADGFYECVAISTSNGNGAGGWHIMRLLGAGDSTSYQGDGVSGVYVKSVQLNTGSVALDYCPTTSTPRTSGQNLVTYSDDLTNAAWSKTRSTIAASGTTPSGKPAFKLTEDTTATNNHGMRRDFTFSSGQTYTISTVVKAVERTSVQIYMYGWAASEAVFDLSTGQVTSINPNAKAATITSLGSGWYRITATYAYTGTGSGIQMDLRSGSNGSYTGDGTSGVLTGEWQFNEGATALPYTSTTTATINNGSGYVSKWYDQSGVVYPNLADDPGFDNPSAWTITSGWSVTGGKAECSTDTGTSRWISQTNKLTVGKIYKITADVIVTAGNLTPDISGTAEDVTTSGAKTWVLKATSTSLSFLARPGFIGSIDNIEVRECRDLIQTTTASQPLIVFAGTINRMNLDIVTGGGFDTIGTWSTNTGITVSGGLANFNTTSNEQLTQPVQRKAGASYQVKLTMSNYVRGNPMISIGQGATVSIPTGNGEKIITVIAGATDSILRVYGGQFGSGGQWSLDNISAIPLVNGILETPKPCMKTDGVDDNMATGSFTVAQPFTRASVLQFFSTTLTSQVFLNSYNDSPHSPLYMNNGAPLKIYAGVDSMTVKSGIVVGDKATVVESIAGASSSGSYNGVVSNGNAGTQSIDGLRIGANSSGANFSNANFSEIIIFPSALSSSDRTKWESNAKAYWGTP